ncbi:MAG: amidohydrolase, partial [Thermaerobacterales bacterium]
MTERFVIRAGWLLTPDDQQGVTVAKDQAIAVDGGIIHYVGSPAGLPESFQRESVIDASDAAVTPGFVNTHNHAAMTLLRGYADDMRLMEWLNEKIWPAEAKLNEEDIYWGTQLAIAEQLRAGVTTFADMYFFMDSVAEAVDQSGSRAFLSRGMIGIKDGADQALREGVDLFEHRHGTAEGRITVALGPHAPYTCPDGFIREVMAAARRLGAPIQIHLAETRDEMDMVQADRGKRPVAWAADIGLLDLPVLAAHCVHVDDRDIKILAETGTAVAHNPISNLKLASGIAPVNAMLDAGITVGLGTDGACSTNHLNLFEEMRLAAWLQKVSAQDAAAFHAATAFRMATVEGARACGLTDVGRIAPSYQADLVIVGLTQPHMIPMHDVLSLIVYSGQTAD